MFERRLGHLVSGHEILGDEVMVKPEEIERMLEMRARGWGAKRIAAELGCARNTVRRYLRAGGAIRYRQPQRACALDAVQGELERSFLQHHGNADVVRQELAREHGLKASLRTVQRAVRPLRRLLKAEARATVRFETAPGGQPKAVAELLCSRRRHHNPRAVRAFGATTVRALLSEAERSVDQRLYRRDDTSQFGSLSGSLLAEPTVKIPFHRRGVPPSSTRLTAKRIRTYTPRPAAANIPRRYMQGSANSFAAADPENRARMNPWIIPLAQRNVVGTPASVKRPAYRGLSSAHGSISA
jgi:hypothetical protein